MTPKTQHILEIALLALLPAALIPCVIFQPDQSAFILMATAIAVLAAFFLLYERSRPALREIMPTAVLAALAVAGRVLFAAFPDVKPVTAICILAGVVFGRRSGFLVGALAALVSNFFFGQGVWTPWQMYAWGLTGYIAGALNDHGAFKHPLAIYLYGFVASFGFGFIMNTWSIVGFLHPLVWQEALIAYGAGAAMDVVHAIATVVFLMVLYAPWKKKLTRIKAKYALAS